ncbi:unnamed protein product, partial [Timema podura]|nr:unnamed protein product [Timema podura]
LRIRRSVVHKKSMPQYHIALATESLSNFLRTRTTEYRLWTYGYGVSVRPFKLPLQSPGSYPKPPYTESSLCVVSVSEDHEYMTPRRAVTSVEDMNIWKESEAYSLTLFLQEIIGFIIALNEAVKGKPLTIDCLLAEVPQNLLELLNKLDLWVEGTPPVEQPQRFGNQAFRTWFDRLKREALELLQQALPERFHRAVPEVMFYLVEGFGNSTRIDYGTGHELAFLMFLCCLFKIGALKSLDQEAVVTKVFNRYLQLVRKLQLTYRMEPAGSHGVWSLDDYQFVPFIWGSSQLIGKAPLFVTLKEQGSPVYGQGRGKLVFSPLFCVVVVVVSKSLTHRPIAFAEGTRALGGKQNSHRKALTTPYHARQLFLESCRLTA